MKLIQIVKLACIEFYALKVETVCDFQNAAGELHHSQSWDLHVP